LPTLLARNADLLVTMDDERRELPNASLFVRNGIIERVGPTEELPQEADVVLDVTGQIVPATVFCAPQKARYTVVNGRVIAENGQVTTVDMAPVIEAHNRFCRELASPQLTRST
jgi:hypothetical protein